MIRLVPNKLIRLGGKLYDIRYTDQDKARREKYFTTNPHEGELTKEETRLLNEIGLTKMDEQLSPNDMKTQMPDFFNALPECQSATAISLSATCYKPNYIISEIMRHAAMKDREEHDEAIKKGAPSLDLIARMSSSISGLMGRMSAPAPPELLIGLAKPSQNIDQDIYDFFELRI